MRESFLRQLPNFDLINVSSHAFNNKIKMCPMIQFRFDQFDDKKCVIFCTHQPSSCLNVPVQI